MYKLATPKKEGTGYCRERGRGNGYKERKRAREDESRVTKQGWGYDLLKRVLRLTKKMYKLQTKRGYEVYELLESKPPQIKFNGVGRVSGWVGGGGGGEAPKKRTQQARG